MTDQKQHLVFVYGTLKRKEPNYKEWLEGQQFVAEGTTVTK